jgi:hypothetical protein
MRTIETKVYTYEELSDSAKANARDWYRGGDYPYDEWWDCIFDDFIAITKILGITLSERTSCTYRLGKDGAKIPVYEPVIYFSGFCSQGDGASWCGDYEYSPGWKKNLLAYCNDKELLRIGEGLQLIQKPYMYQLAARVSQGGRGVHAYTMSVDYIEGRDGKDITEPTVEDDLLDLFRDLAHWLYKSLEREYDYLMGDENVAENIVCNEYEFTEEGKRI